LPDPALSASLVSIVDDDPSFRDSLRRLLKSHGYAVAVFPSAAEFLASAQVSVTACLVADIHMPAMTGAELFHHLVAVGRVIPTILITAQPEEDVRQRMLSLGVRCYLHKPLDEGVLIDCLRRAFACDTSKRVGP
jgi:FixJ family two-component response regulator